MKARTVYDPEIGDKVRVPNIRDTSGRVYIQAGIGTIKSIPEDSQHRLTIELNGKMEHLARFEFDLIIP